MRENDYKESPNLDLYANTFHCPKGLKSDLSKGIRSYALVLL